MRAFAIALVTAVIVVAVISVYLAEHRCPQCGREFESSDAMYRHLDRSHLN